MDQNNTQAQALPELMTVAETAAVLRIGQRTLRHACCGTHPNGNIPLKPGKIAGRVMFRRADVQAYLAEIFGDASPTAPVPPKRRGRGRPRLQSS